ncbi:MAG: cell division protein ZapA [Candidatus Krumholzibacteriia bacterium]|nr:cell division protein ZapA [bacterium]MCB9515099.1 cell division protein ZapA [Candidatus Latescibacterota bacterium]
MASDPQVKVSIFGNEYRVRGDADAEQIQRIADYVDATMSAIAAGGRHVSTTRIAILAAFNIAAELHREREQGGRGSKAEAKAAELLRLFDDDALAAGGGD